MGDEMRNGYFFLFLFFTRVHRTTPGVPLMFFFFTFSTGYFFTDLSIFWEQIFSTGYHSWCTSGVFLFHRSFDLLGTDLLRTKPTPTHPPTYTRAHTHAHPLPPTHTHTHPHTHTHTHTHFHTLAQAHTPAQAPTHTRTHAPPHPPTRTHPHTRTDTDTTGAHACPHTRTPTHAFAHTPGALARRHAHSCGVHLCPRTHSAPAHTRAPAPARPSHLAHLLYALPAGVPGS